jgi:hypothetical protein
VNCQTWQYTGIETLRECSSNLLLQKFILK